MLKKGSKVVLYQDYQQNKDPMGVAKLIQFVKSSYPFILDEQNEASQETYIIEYWEVEWIDKYIDTINPERKIFPIRNMTSVGLTTTSNIPVEEYEPNMLMDKFLMVNGKEIF